LLNLKIIIPHQFSNLEFLQFLFYYVIFFKKKILVREALRDKVFLKYMQRFLKAVGMVSKYNYIFYLHPLHKTKKYKILLANFKPQTYFNVKMFNVEHQKIIHVMCVNHHVNCELRSWVLSRANFV